MRKHWFVVVVGERFVEPGLDDRLRGFGRVAGGLHPQPGLPQSEVVQDAFDEGDDADLILAVGAQERVELRMETTGRKALVRRVLSWMPDVRVLAPKSLLDRTALKLEEGLRRNGENEDKPDQTLHRNRGQARGR